MKQSILHRGLSLLLTLVLALSLAAPAGAEGTTGTANVTVTLDQTTLTLWTNPADGSTTEVKEATLTATIAGAGSDATVEWSSNDEAVAKVKQDSTGKNEAKITALKSGTATIFATYRKDNNQVQATCHVTVNTHANSIAINQPSDMELAVGESVQLSAYIDPPTATDYSATNVTWTCTNTGDSYNDDPAASVDESGRLTALRPGKVSVSVETKDGKHKSTVSMEFVISGIYLNQENLTLLMGKSENVYPTCFGKAEENKNDLQWITSNSAVAGVKGGRITAISVGTATITVFAGTYRDTVEVTVEENTQTVVEADTKAEANTPYGLTRSLAEQIQKIAKDEFESELIYMNNLSVTTGNGTLYYGYSSPDAPGHGVGGVEKYVYMNPTGDQMGFTDVTLVPKADFSGTLEITYTGHCQNGRSFSGVIRIQVENHGDVAYSTAEERPLPFAAEDFSAVCNQKTGKSLRCVTFKQPAESKGTLYFHYSETGQFSPKVSESTKYYVSGGTALLDDITFVPAEGFTGTVPISYVANNSGNVSYAGTLVITVYPADGTGLGANVSYSTSPGAPVTFRTADFNEACQEKTGTSLNYLYVDLPDASQGTLYYNYKSSSNYGSTVSASTRYFRSSKSEPEIEKLTFVPADGFTGTVTIPYTGYPTGSGQRYEGDIVIRVSGTAGTITYRTSTGRAVDFQGLDFNEVCQNSNNKAMKEVSFSLPSSSAGTLYYRYGTSSSKAVKTSNTYSKSQLDDITFVPKRGYSGTVSFSFSGKDTADGAFGGTVEVEVSTASGSDDITYTTHSGGSVSMDAADFNAVSRYLTGDNVDYVRFTLPNSKHGTLYYQYDPDKKTNTKVSTSYNYYRTQDKSSDRLLSEVFYVAPESYTGTVTIEYTGRSTGGDGFEGTVDIVVSAPAATQITYAGAALPVHLRLSDFRAACQSVLGKPLSYIQFTTLPTAAYGKLVWDYYGDSTAVSTGTRYLASGSPAIDSLSFVPKAGYEGTVTFSYTAVDTAGESVKGTVRITLDNDDLTPSFVDLNGYQWATPSIEFLRDAGVVNGYGNGIYGPARATSRGDFVLMVCRIFDFDLISGTSFPDVPNGSLYAQAAATAKALGIVNGIDGQFQSNTPVTRQQAVVMLERAMKAAGWSVTAGSLNLLYNYQDGSQVAGYAQQAMADFIRMGAISGDERGYLNPAKTMSRAEIASMLHRLLTM